MGRNMKNIRDANIPMALKYLVVGFFMGTWKWTYYAPNTYKELRIKEFRKEDQKKLEKYMNDPKYDLHGPYFFYRFFILPLPWLLIGNYLNAETAMSMYYNAMATLFLADVVENIHTFIIIATNHAGNDLYKFSSHCKPKSGMFFMRQVISSANYAAGTDLVDFAHGFLNYQIEHHIWPDLSMKSYQRAMPLVKELCDFHNIPYIQESVFVRLKKTVDIMIGKTSMREFPEGVIIEN